MKRFLYHFLQGLLYIIPIAVTVYVLVKCFSLADSLADWIFGSFHVDKIPGLGFVVLIGFITLVGYVCPILISPQMSKLINKLISKAPLIRLVYTSVRDLMAAFVGKKRKFGTPVVVSLDNEGIINRLGFITNEDLENLNIKDKVAVCFPNSYGMLGELILVPKERVTKLDVVSTDVMKFIVSGGVTKIDQNNTEDADTEAK